MSMNSPNGRKVTRRVPWQSAGKGNDKVSVNVEILHKGYAVYKRIPVVVDRQHLDVDVAIIYDREYVTKRVSEFTKYLLEDLTRATYLELMGNIWDNWHQGDN